MTSVSLAGAASATLAACGSGARNQAQPTVGGAQRG